MSQEQLDEIISRVVAKSSDNGEDFLSHRASFERQATERLSEGWTVLEVVELFKWTEHIQPDIDEAYALRRMAFVRERVAARMKQEGVVQ